MKIAWSDQVLLLARFLAFLLAGSFAYSIENQIGDQPATIEDLWVSGSREANINLGVLAEGYRSDELDQFVEDAQQVIDYLFDTSPYREYRNYFNAFAVPVASTESGSDHPLLGIDKDTYFNSTYSSFGLAQTLTIPPNDRDPNPENGYGKAHQLLADVLPEWDLIVFLVNDSSYGGWGDQRGAISSVHPSMPEIIVHELAHTFAGLGDGYETPFPQDPEPVKEEPNTTRETLREKIKWRNWIDAETPIPTPEIHTYSQAIGLFEGARYRASGWYRPSLNCRMRNLYTPFCQVCREALIRSVYSFTSPIIKTTPERNDLEVERGVPLEFIVEIHEPLSHTLSVRWSINGKWLPEDDEPATLRLENLSAGHHEVKVEVSDPTPWVLDDPDNLLNETATWTINVAPSDSVPEPFFVPVYQDEGSGFTGVAVVNPHQKDVLLKAEPLGIESPVPVPSLLLPGNSQLARLARELLNLNPGSIVRGWISLQAQEVPMEGYFLIGDGLRFLDGGASLHPFGSMFYFSRVSEGTNSFRGLPAKTVLGLGNPGDEEARVALRLYSNDAGNTTLQSEVDILLPPEGVHFTSLSATFGYPVEIDSAFLEGQLIDGPPVLVTGRIELDGETLMVLQPHGAGHRPELWSAQLATGRFSDHQTMFTELQLINTAADERQVTVRTFSEDGTQLAPERLFSIQSADARTIEAEELLDDETDPETAVIGSVQILSDGPGILGDLFFGDADGGKFATSVPLQDDTFSDAIFPHVATVQGLFTGLAFFNPGSESCQIEIRVFQSDGQMVGATTISLPPSGRISRLVTEFIPESQGRAEGFIRIQSSQPIIAQQLFGHASLEYLAAVTPIIIE